MILSQGFSLLFSKRGTSVIGSDRDGLRLLHNQRNDIAMGRAACLSSGHRDL